MKNVTIFLVVVLVGLSVALTTTGCKKEETPTGGGGGTTVPALSVTPSSISVAAGANATAVIRGGVKPYSILTASDTLFATASIGNDSVLTVSGVSSGLTSLVVRDNDTGRVTVTITVTGSITHDLFPLVNGRSYIYTGYAISTSGAQLPDPNNVYRTRWILAPGLPGTTAIVDTTTFQHPQAGVVTASRTLLVKKNASGDYEFMQTLGPFYRAFGISSSDTLRWFVVAKPSIGSSGTWTAFDSTFASPSGNVRLEIRGEMLGTTTVTDSSTSRRAWSVYKTRTYRNVFLGGSQIVNNATTSELWLAPNVGPVQVHIAQDTENLGHFRIMKDKNF